MSVRSIQVNVERTQREIENLNRKLTTEAAKEANLTDKIIKAREQISRTKSQSIVGQRLRDIRRYERDIGVAQKNRANISKQITDKTARLHRYQQELMKEQGREHDALLKSIKQQQTSARMARASIFDQIAPRSAELGSSSKTYDAFISYASEDKEELVRPLAEKLVEAEFEIWFDDFELKVGDSLRRSIDKGLKDSRFGIVVLSPSFFAKNWPAYELDGLVSREVSEGRTVVLPLWHKLSKDEVMRYSPSLADKVALNTAVLTLDELVGELSRSLHPSK